MAKSKSSGVSVEQVKKYAFWGVIPVLVLAVLAVAFMGVSSVGARFESRKTQLENQKKLTEAISQDSAHPNDKTIADINNHTKDLRVRVSDAWMTLQADQAQRSRWPDDIGRDFLNMIEPKRFGDEITNQDREVYGNFIERALPAMEVTAQRRRLLVKDSRGKWTEADKQRTTTGMMDAMSSRGTGSGSSSSSSRGSSSSTGSGSGTGSGAMADMVSNPDEKWEGIVDWDSPEIWNIRSSWDKSNPPTAKEIWYAQEDLWVYDALISVVVASNVGATGPHNAKIKRIEEMLIGQVASVAVADQFNKSLTLTMGEDGMGGEGMGGESMGSVGMLGRSSEGMAGGDIRNAASLRDAIETKILDYRYIDDKGQPLLATDTPPFPQFKRMPVCLRLVVDQRYIPQILVNCANCPMPIDVFFVKYNPPEAPPFDLSQYISVASLGGGGGSMMGMGGSSSSSRGAGGTGRSGTGGMSGGDLGAEIDGSVGIYGPESVPIEIYGVINIFNRPDDSLTQPTEDSTAVSTP